MKNIEILSQNGISALAFSKNQAYCAIGTKKNSKVYIFQIKTFNNINSWILLQQISDHTQTIAEIDWSLDQKIITASHDRSVFVWRKNNQKWDKMLVTIDVKLSVMACKWAPSCKKFALGACPTSLYIGFYNTVQKIWTAVFKQSIVKTPIVSLDFHPSCNILALGTLDGSLKILTCNLRKNTQQHIVASKVDDFPYTGPFQKVDSYFEVLYTIDSILPNMNIWINHVSFENKGNNLLVLTHSRHIKFYDVNQGQKILINQKDITHNGLPFMKGLYNNEKQQIVLAGYDRKVSVFSKNGNFLFDLGDNFKFNRHLQKNQKSNKSNIKGLVQGMLKGIQKKQWTFGDHPKPQEHKNTAKVVKARNTYVSYDLNGVIHFWQ